MNILKIFNSLSKKKEVFTPISQECIKMYSCGPTVYKNIHIGNLRPLLVFDLLYKLLNILYKKVIYVRNITDVDDKIINIATEKDTTPYNISVSVIKEFHDSCSLLKLESPTIEPKVTDHINDIIDFIKELKNSGFAYETGSEVMFDTSMDKGYGRFSEVKNNVDGARTEINIGKKNVNDFVLWKNKEDFSFESPWGNGRPGWHIECSAMSNKYLGDVFDIHCGGQDLQFPHHENEISQGIGRFGNLMSNYWVHNGMVMIDKAKMSKSLCNEISVAECLKTQCDGASLRYLFFKTHYRNPLNFSFQLLNESKSHVQQIKIFIETYRDQYGTCSFKEITGFSEYIDYLPQELLNDLNTPPIINLIHTQISSFIKNKSYKSFNKICFLVDLLGLDYIPEVSIKKEDLEKLMLERKQYKDIKDFQQSDIIRETFKSYNIQTIDYESFSRYIQY
jgi:cysteinyl-tRNA synthetase